MDTAGNSLAPKTKDASRQKAEDASRQKKDQGLKFFVFGALWTLLLAAFAVLIIMVMFWWQAWSTSTRMWEDMPHTVDLQKEVLEKTLAAYKAQVDDMQHLVTLLTGLASFYTLALGITSYFTAQHIIDRSKESAEDIDDYRTEAKKIYDGLEEQYPIFINLGGNIGKALDRLILLLPNEEERDEFWEKLKEVDKQEILFLELSTAFVQHLDDKRIAILYRRLGKFYSAWYAVSKEDAGNTPPLPPGRNVNTVADLAIRAFFYLERAVERDSKNFTALNDFGVACTDMWKLPAKPGESRDEYQRRAQSMWADSLRLEPNQQRARYNRANSLKRENKIEEAIAELRRALGIQRWEHKASPIHVKDIHYNLACYESLLGAQHEKAGEAWDKLSEAAAKNLRAGCEHYNSSDRVKAETLKALEEDCKAGGDLFWLAQKSPESIEAAKRLLA
jgi:tetratricopeptide (TPR) repeat protein